MKSYALEPEFGIPAHAFAIDLGVNQDEQEAIFYSIGVRLDTLGPNGFSVDTERLGAASMAVYETNTRAMLAERNHLWIEMEGRGIDPCSSQHRSDLPSASIATWKRPC